VVELRKKQWGTTPRRQKRRDFDAVYYLGVHNRGGGNSPVPGNSSTDNKWNKILPRRTPLYSLDWELYIIFIVPPVPPWPQRWGDNVPPHPAVAPPMTIWHLRVCEAVGVDLVNDNKKCLIWDLGLLFGDGWYCLDTGTRFNTRPVLSFWNTRKSQH